MSSAGWAAFFGGSPGLVGWPGKEGTPAKEVGKGTALGLPVLSLSPEEGLGLIGALGKRRSPLQHS